MLSVSCGKMHWTTGVIGVRYSVVTLVVVAVVVAEELAVLDADVEAVVV